MQRTTLFVVGLVITASLVGAVGPALAQSDDDVVTLTVEVVNPSTNQRLGGVTLVATWNGGESRVTTASNGRVFIDVPEAASVEITPDDDSYTRNEPYRIRVATEREHTIEVFRKADVDVVVRDAEGPVADARVALAQDGIEVVSGRTGADGLFQSGTVAQGRYTLTATKPGYYRLTDEIIVAGSPEETVRIERGRVDYDIVVEDPYFDPAEPVSDATVSVNGVGEFQTDQRGGVAVLLPVNSEVDVEISKDGYETVTRTVTVNESVGSTALDLSREVSLSLTALNERVVVGEVVPVEVTNAYGEPASGVVILVDGEQAARTDSNGRAAVRIQEPGDRSIQARQGETTSEAVTIRGIGEGGAETQTTTAQGTAAATTAPADGSGTSPLTEYGPIVAAIVGLLVVLALVALYWRRRNNRTSDPSAWADDPLEPTDSGGSVGFGDDTGTEGTAGAAAGTAGASAAADEADTEGASAAADEADAESATGSAAGTGAETGDTEMAAGAEETEQEPETEEASDAADTATEATSESDGAETEPDATETQTESQADGMASDATDSDTTDSDTTESDTTESDTTDSDTTESDTTESDTTDSDPETKSDAEQSGDDEQT